MKNANSGWAFHCHHDRLIEWCWDYRERVKYIQAQKAEKEIALRLKLFRLIPIEEMKKIFRQKAGADWHKADADRQKAGADWRKANADWQKAHAERCKILKKICPLF